MPNVKVREGESPEAALRRFKRACEKDGLIQELRSRKEYEKPTTARKRCKAAAVKRAHKKMLRDNPIRQRKY